MGVEIIANQYGIIEYNYYSAVALAFTSSLPTGRNNYLFNEIGVSKF